MNLHDALLDILLVDLSLGIITRTLSLPIIDHLCLGLTLLWCLSILFGASFNLGFHIFQIGMIIFLALYFPLFHTVVFSILPAF